MNDTTYIRYASPIENQKMVPIHTNIYEFVLNTRNKEHYTSLYEYNKSQYDTFLKKTSVAGFTGMKSRYIAFDFDHHTQLELAIADAQELTKRLKLYNFTEQDIQVYFSGSKGIHILLSTAESFNKTQIANIVRFLGKGLDTLDSKIYDEQRIFRCPLSLNKKSGLYKVPLTVDSLFLLKPETIRESGKSITTEHEELMVKWNLEVQIPAELLKIANSVTETKSKVELTEFERLVLTKDGPDFSQKPRHLTDTKYALQEGFFEEGERNEAYLILAATYKFLGYSKDIAYNMIKATDRIHVKRAEANGVKRLSKPKDEIWKQILNPVYSDSWKNGTFSEEETPLLIKTKKRYNLSTSDEVRNKTIDIGNVKDATLSFAANIDQNKITLGIPSIDNKVMITTGMLVALLGAASSSKTTLALNIMRNLSMNDQSVLFFSLDMYTPFILSRLIQRHVPMSFQGIIDEIKNNNFDGKLKEAWNQVQEEYRNVKFNFKSGPTCDDIEEQLKHMMALNNQTPKLVVIDYLEKINGPYTDSTANSAYIAGRLSDMARDYNTCILLLVQPQKSAGTPAEPLLSYRNIKGSSRLEQDCRVVLTVWRPGFNPANNDLDKYASIAVVKNNMGNVFQSDFVFNGAKGSYEEIVGTDMQTRFDNDMNTINERRMNQAQARERGYIANTGDI